MGRVEHAAERVFSLHLVAIHARIQHAAIGVAQNKHPDGDVFARIPFGVMNDRQSGEIDIVAREHHLFHRRLVARHRFRFQRRRRAVAKTLQDGAFGLARIDPERETEERVTAENAGRQRQL